WSYSEVARRGNISSARISQVIAGEKPGRAFCEGIARAFGLSPDDVMRRAGLLPPLPVPSERWLRLNELWGRLSDEDQERILEIAEAWVQKRGKQPAPQASSQS
ncbi:MAG TPA: XRE family transcriptional regulator, partial [Anaerolineae bacterium]|nr:XRE family transcriptional regulator [Anaerolineae bacterium]